MANLTKKSWEDVRKALESVPRRYRNNGWMGAMLLVKRILSDTCELAPDLDPATMRFSVECSICKRLIGIDEDFMFRAVEAKWSHYDCQFLNSNGKTPWKERSS